ncbi:PREDICTED: G2/mitotic-specific cyclin-A1-like [Nicrophorus vespilloides]|uniref:G2/mitotic-specific cyclin-A1-like n=1 Tax=Nicrophorus vespilloides TaxID=110193 RepID=A0ABM1M9Z6_NICVS|nr:PREDICTED: G2/mitotic-specific cyclin-A1-like [Nicrophorus vespilloides]
MERIIYEKENKRTKITRQRLCSDSMHRDQNIEIKRERTRSTEVQRAVLGDLQRNVVCHRKIFNGDIEFTSLQKKCNISPILKSAFLQKKDSNSPILKKKDSRKKVNFINKLEQRKTERRTNEPVTKVLHLYTLEYLEDIIKHMLKKEKSQVLHKGFMLKYSACEESRRRVVLWFYKFENEFNISYDMRYVIIKMFDRVLANMHVPRDKYHLFMITIIFILSKHSSVNAVSMAKLLNACKGHYIQEQILILEKDLLVFFEYNFMLNEPIQFVQYYLHKIGPNSEEIVKIMKQTQKIIRDYALTTEFSIHPSSKVAAAAVYASLRIIYGNTRLYDISSNIQGYYYGPHLLPMVYSMGQLNL